MRLYQLCVSNRAFLSNFVKRCNSHIYSRDFVFENRYDTLCPSPMGSFIHGCVYQSKIHPLQLLNMLHLKNPFSTAFNTRTVT